MRLGIVLDTPRARRPRRSRRRCAPPAARARAAGGAGADALGVIGAGNYLKSMILRSCRVRGGTPGGSAPRAGLMPQALRLVSLRACHHEAAQLIADPAIDALVIATRHDSHARLALDALRAGKHVYVEKPLALTDEELAPILDVLAARGAQGPTLWLGHNRRFSPFTRDALAHLERVELRQVSCTVRSAGVPADSWYQDAAEGGGLLFGDVCHFIDLALASDRARPPTCTPSRRATRGGEKRAGRFRSNSRTARSAPFTSDGRQPARLGSRGRGRTGGGRSARIVGFRRLVLHGGAGGGRWRLQPDLGQRGMLEAMLRQFARTGPDHTHAFIASAQVLLAARPLDPRAPRGPLGPPLSVHAALSSRAHLIPTGPRPRQDLRPIALRSSR